MRFRTFIDTCTVPIPGTKIHSKQDIGHASLMSNAAPQCHTIPLFSVGFQRRLCPLHLTAKSYTLAQTLMIKASVPK